MSVFSDAIDYPNGLAFSLDGRTLYVAQIFQSITPIVPDDRIWAMPLGEDGMPSGRRPFWEGWGRGRPLMDWW